MNANTLKLLPAFLLAGMTLLVSCSREEPTLAPVPPVVLGDVQINEIYSRGTTTDPDWVELYNPSSVQVNISGYKIYDAGGQGGTKPKKEIPAGAVIPAKGFYVIVTDGTGASDFGLSSAGEQVWLENTAGTLIDAVTFTAMDVTQTYGRYPDGGTTWQLLNTITRGTANRP